MKKTVLNIPPSHRDYAMTLGAFYDKEIGCWCVLGDVPTELLDYIDSAPRQRDYVADRVPACPKCGCGMKLRTGQGYDPFWGCSNYPRCKEKVQLDEFDASSPTKASDFFHAVPASLPVHVPDERGGEPLSVKEEAQRLVNLAIDLLGSEPAASRWFKKEKITLGGKRPIDLIVTLDGCASVEKLLRDALN
jgi:ssDNA-binding Zn-finger/Zn-ribbon topoisomerase 1